jgi:hypothetical protein
MGKKPHGEAAVNPRTTGSTGAGEAVSPQSQSREERPPPHPWLHRQFPLAALLIVVAALADIGLWATFFGGPGGSQPVSGSAPDIRPSDAQPGQARPAGGHPSSSAGIRVQSTLLASGVLETHTHVGFPHPVSRFEMSVTPAGTTRIRHTFHPTIDHLHVLVAGRPVTGVPLRIGAGHDVRVSLPTNTKAVEVAYQATGVIARSLPSKAGRALMLATPLHISASMTTMTMLSLRGSQVLNVGCWPPGSPPQVCGNQIGEGWTVRLPAHAGADDVVAQINLPTRAHLPSAASG